MIEVMVNLISDTDRDCNQLSVFIYLVREKLLASWMVDVWMIPYIHLLHRFDLLPTWIFLIKGKFYIENMLIKEMDDKCKILSF